MSAPRPETLESRDAPAPAEERLGGIGAVDVVVGVLAVTEKEELDVLLQAVRDALGTLTIRTRAVLVHDGSAADPAAVGELPREAGDVAVLPYPLFEPGSLGGPIAQFSTGSQALFALTEKLGARSCAVLASDGGTTNSHRIHQLLRPIIELDFDLVAPCYSRPKFDGLLNTSILAPLTRALYGKRIQSPAGPDFGFSARLVAALLQSHRRTRTTAPENSFPSIASAAVRGGYEVCQAYLGSRVRPVADTSDLSSLLAQVLGPVFLDIEGNAVYWQKTRGSEPIPQFGASEVWTGDSAAADAQPMIDSFHLGWRNLLEVWRTALPPATLFELGKLSRLPREQFHIPDELWVRIVYDFALAHRVSRISREHLLRSMTPLYLAWTASYALEVEKLGPAEVDRRTESLALAYEAGKPYLLSRWRWPDRFNP